MNRVSYRAVWASTVAAALVTAMVAALPSIPAAAQSPALRLVLDTVVTLVALLLAYLVHGRFLLQRRTADLLLVFTLGLAAVVNAGLAVAPQLGLLGPDGLTLLVWGPPIGRLLVSTGFTACAWLPRTHTSSWRRPGLLVVLACLGVPALVAAAILTTAHLLPVYDLPDLDTRGPQLPVGVDERAVVALRLSAGVLYAVAAVGFVRRWAGDPLAPALVAAVVLLAFSRLNYAFVPSLHPQWVYAGDLLRLAAYGVLLVGAGGEIRRSWEGQAQAAVQEERRRVARALHDGVAQEITLVATQTRLWADGRKGMEPRLLAGAAERALDESRAAIHALTGDLDEPLHVALLRVADDLQGRLGLRIVTDVETVGPLPRPVHDTVVRAAREAVVNAARHGQVDRVRVSLRGDDVVRLVVTDQGCGFDPAAPREGFGLAAVRGRLVAIGGSLRIESAPGAGTRLEVEVPWPT